MKKQNLFLCIAIVVSVVIAVLLIVKVNRDDKRNREAIAQLGRESMLLAPVQHEQLELLDFNLMNIARSEVGDVNGGQFILSDSLKADKTIVIYISAYYCKDCVDFVLGHIGVLNEKASCDTGRQIDSERPACVRKDQRHRERFLSSGKPRIDK